MWRQLLFWAMVEPKHFHRFLLPWLLLVGLLFYVFVHDAFDGSAERALPPHPAVTSVANR
jgi:hypothetical protein